MVTVSESFWSDLKFIETWLSCFCRSAGHHRAQQSIDSQHYKRLRRKIRTTFHSLSHFTHTTTQLNLSSNLKTLHYSKTIERLVLSFGNVY